jgi:uncharacterized protein YbaR (Trm112 family)
MYPPIWGPHWWMTIHTLTYSCVDTTCDVSVNKCVASITTLLENLPCPACRHHALEYVKQYPIPTHSIDARVDWGISFHNAVNRRLNKPELTLQEGKTAIVNTLKENALKANALKVNALKANALKENGLKVNALKEHQVTKRDKNALIALYVSFTLLIISLVLLTRDRSQACTVKRAI